MILVILLEDNMTPEKQIIKLEARKNLIMTRDPVANVNICRKIDRKLRKLRNK